MSSRPLPASLGLALHAGLRWFPKHLEQTWSNLHLAEEHLPSFHRQEAGPLSLPLPPWLLVTPLPLLSRSTCRRSTGSRPPFSAFSSMAPGHASPPPLWEHLPSFHRKQAPFLCLFLHGSWSRLSPSSLGALAVVPQEAGPLSLPLPPWLLVTPLPLRTCRHSTGSKPLFSASSSMAPGHASPEISPSSLGTSPATPWLLSSKSAAPPPASPCQGAGHTPLAGGRRGSMWGCHDWLLPL